MDSENTKEVPNTESPSTLRSLKFKWVSVILGVLFIILLIGTYLLSRNYLLPGIKSALRKPAPSSIPATFAENEEKLTWHQPKWYLATDQGGNLLLGNLADKSEVVVSESKGKILGQATFESVSPSGRYFLYIQLPDKIIEDFQENPPYEYHGSSDYDLHLVTINNDQVTDKIIDTHVASLLGPNVFAFDKDERGVYYQKYENKEVTYYYDIQAEQASPKALPEYLGANAFLSTSRSSYALLDTFSKDPSDTGLNSKYELFRVSIDGKSKESVTEFTSGEHSIIFPFENTLFIAREDYVNGPNSICYIEKVDIGQGKSTPSLLEKRNCPPGFNNTNYHSLTVSPDEKNLVALYAEQGPSDQVGTSNVFVYNLKTSEKKTLAQATGLYEKYFWVSPIEILVGIPFRDAKRVNVETGKTEVEGSFHGKSIQAVF